MEKSSIRNLNLNQSRLQWVVKFIGLKITKLSSSGVRKLHADLNSFLVSSGEASIPGSVIAYCTDFEPSKSSGKAWYEEEKLLALQSETKEIIEGLVDNKRLKELLGNRQFHKILIEEGSESWLKKVFARQENFPALNAPKNPKATNVSVSIKLLSIPGDFIKNPFNFTRTSLNIFGPFRDVFLFKLMVLLSQEQLSSLMRCPSPICDRAIFVRTGKRMYCSNRCSKIMTQRKWRENIVNRSAEALAARQRRASRKQQSINTHSRSSKKLT